MSRLLISAMLAAVWGTLAAVSAGCALPHDPFREHLDAAAPLVRDCAAWYVTLDEAVEASGVRDAQHRRVPGFPYMRVDGMLASQQADAARSVAALDAFAVRLVELDLQARAFEIQNLRADRVERVSGPKAALARTRDCARLLRELDLARPDRRAAMLRAATAADARPAVACAAVSEPARPRAGTGVVRYAPPPAAVPARAEVASLTAQAHLDPLKQPLLSEAELAEIAPLYAPSFEIAIEGNPDRFGALRWLRGAETPQVDASQLAVYVHSAFARYQQRVLLQLVYTIWFPEPLHAVMWRVTLGPDAEPLVYDSVLPCGCDRSFFPTSRARLRRPGGAHEERPFVPALPRVGEGMRPVLSLASATRRIEAVSLVRGADSLVRYELRPYDELRSLQRLDGGRRSAFGPDGRVPGSHCRQWGHDFDDPGEIGRRFELDLAP